MAQTYLLGETSCSFRNQNKWTNENVLQMKKTKKQNKQKKKHAAVSQNKYISSKHTTETTKSQTHKSWIEIQ